jgi:hypothetical protein
MSQLIHFAILEINSKFIKEWMVLRTLLWHLELDIKNYSWEKQEICLFYEELICCQLGVLGWVK